MPRRRCLEAQYRTKSAALEASSASPSWMTQNPSATTLWGLCRHVVSSCQSPRCPPGIQAVRTLDTLMAQATQGDVSPSNEHTRQELVPGSQEDTPPPSSTGTRRRPNGSATLPPHFVSRPRYSVLLCDQVLDRFYDHHAACTKNRNHRHNATPHVFHEAA